MLQDVDYATPQTLAQKFAPVTKVVNKMHVFRFLRDLPDTSKNKNKPKSSHPAVALLHRDLYWEAGGCDEDFVGSYGSTDPHFWYRLGQHDPKFVLKIPTTWPPLQIVHSRGESLQKRDPVPNKLLFAKKKRGEVKWSNNYLRFGWQQACYPNDCKTDAKQMPKVTQPDASVQVWEPSQILAHMSQNPSRAYFCDLFRLGGFKTGVEVGVAGGRFSEHFLKNGRPQKWFMVEPFPSKILARKLPEVKKNSRVHTSIVTWSENRIGTNITFMRHLSLDASVFKAMPAHVDFVYLDGDHRYETVRQELTPYFKLVRPGGILAGHAYQSHGEFTPLKCHNCQKIPRARKYTDYGVKHGKGNTTAKSQAGVVRAVQEWLVKHHPTLKLHYTEETFTRDSLAKDGFDYDLVITSTSNPSWYIIKPLAIQWSSIDSLEKMHPQHQDYFKHKHDMFRNALREYPAIQLRLRNEHSSNLRWAGHCPSLAPKFTFNPVLDDPRRHGGRYCDMVVVTSLFGNADQLNIPKDWFQKRVEDQELVLGVTSCWFAFVDTSALENIQSKLSLKPSSISAIDSRNSSGQVYRIMLDPSKKNSRIALWHLVHLTEDMHPWPSTELALNSRVPKMLSHHVFGFARYMLYLDAKLVLQIPLTIWPLVFSELVAFNATWTSPRHTRRQSAFDEARCARYLGLTHDEPIEQFITYHQKGMPLHPSTQPPLGLIEGEWHIRDLRDPRSSELACGWFSELIKWKHKRDQLCFNYVLWSMYNSAHAQRLSLPQRNFFRYASLRSSQESFQHRARKHVHGKAGGSVKRPQSSICKKVIPSYEELGLGPNDLLNRDIFIRTKVLPIT